MSLRIVVADDSILVREGVATLLAAGGMKVVGKVGSARELLELVPNAEPDAVLVDIRMPPSYSDEGIRAADALDESRPGLGVLVLSQYVELAFAMRLLERRTAGRGYILKDRIADQTTLLSAVRTVAAGGSFVDHAVVAPLVEREHVPEGLRDLSSRERDILSQMAEGRSNAAICASLFLSPKTVEGYTRTIFQKLDLPQAADDHRRVLAVLRYLRASVVAP